MKVHTKLAAFGVVLGLSFAGGAALGAVVGPIDVGGSPSHSEPMTPSTPSTPSTSVPAHEGGH